MKSVRALALGVAVTAVLILAATALAAEVSRSEYREGAEPICTANTKANERILGGVKAEVRGGKLKTAAAKFAKAAAALKRTQLQLEALPQPAADQGHLGKWFAYVNSEVSYFEAIANKLRAGKKGAAERYVSKLSVTATHANNAVLPFEFDYCRFEPSRFT